MTTIVLAIGHSFSHMIRIAAAVVRAYFNTCSTCSTLRVKEAGRLASAAAVTRRTITKNKERLSFVVVN